MNNIKISVIVIYKDEKNLENCINSLLKQTFTNIEIILVNNAAPDNTQNIVNKAVEQDERIKLITLPFENDEAFAKKAGLGISDGDFIFFINKNENIPTNFIMDKYVNSNIKENIKIKDNHLYRRSFLENDEEITGLIQEKIKQEIENYSKTIKEQKEEIKKEFDKFYQTNEENIKNNSYEITCRFNQLEKNFYEKDYLQKEYVKNTIEENNKYNEAAIKTVYEDISKIYDYINGEINKKGSEINKVYEEITKNYNYTEELIENKKNELIESSNNKANSLNEKVNELEKEIILRYTNLKRLMDMQLDDLKLKLNSSGFESNSSENYINKTLSENLDNIYSQLNKITDSFYTEISNTYKELNNKIIENKEEYKYLLEQKTIELEEKTNRK